MPTEITYHGNDDNLLAQVCTDAELEINAAQCTENAIGEAYAAAGVPQAYFGNEVNEIELLAASTGAALPVLILAAGAVDIVGRAATFGATSGAAASDIALSGKKAFLVKVDAEVPAEGSELYLQLIKPDMSNSITFAINGVGLGVAVADPFEEGPIVWEHTTGDTYAVYRDAVTGEWGMVLPDGTDTGNLEPTLGGFTGDIRLVLGSSGSAPGTMTMLNSGGPALPVGYSAQQFA